MNVAEVHRRAYNKCCKIAGRDHVANERIAKIITQSTGIKAHAATIARLEYGKSCLKPLAETMAKFLEIDVEEIDYIRPKKRAKQTVVKKYDAQIFFFGDLRMSNFDSVFHLEIWMFGTGYSNYANQQSAIPRAA